jgi:hypothetical protein
MIVNNHTDTIDRLNAMREQEQKRAKCFNYLEANNGDIDDGCRRAMVTWINQVRAALSLSPDTVWIAMSLFDQYLSSGEGNSREVLRSKRKFQLACITAYYTAVKIHEPVVLGLDMLMQICRGTYTESDVTSMERDILTALNWRVCGHTPIEFVRNLLEMTPDQIPSSASESLLGDCQKHLDLAISDVASTCSRPSDVGMSCLQKSLDASKSLSPSEKQSIRTRLSEWCSFDLPSNMQMRRNLPSEASGCTSKGRPKFDLSSSISSCKIGGGSSPVCVTHAARQA